METEKLNVLVIGDIMLDEYIIGIVDRISPEAPVPIVLEKERRYCLGGCGNVANNLRSLHVNVTCISVVGYGIYGTKIKTLLNSACINSTYIITTSIPTTIKTRVITDNKIQMLRIDKEITNYDKSLKNKIIKNIKFCLKNNKFHAIIISDYNKGMFFKDIINTILKYSNYSTIFADIKPCNIKYLTGQIYLLKPNEKEYKEIENEKISSEYILKTVGKKGMILLDANKKIMQTIKSTPVEVYNVSGAGDTVIAVLATCNGLNTIDLYTSIYIANECGRYVVQYSDTTPIDYTFFMNLINSNLTDKVDATVS
jgi:rfaE bifunctional protein kinase chain/domain